MHYKGIEVPILEDVHYPRLDELNVTDTVEEALIMSLHLAQTNLEMHRYNAENLKYSSDGRDQEDARYAVTATANAFTQRHTIVQIISYIYGPLYAEYIIDKVLARINDALLRKTLRVEL